MTEWTITAWKEHIRKLGLARGAKKNTLLIMSAVTLTLTAKISLERITMKTIQQHEDTLRANMGIIQRTRKGIKASEAATNRDRKAVIKAQAELDKYAARQKAAIRDNLKRY
tara:strand:+ start:2098 stop:2433 length:336 start_codon:yes stop_codon:yes gene_type:complete